MAEDGYDAFFGLGEGRDEAGEVEEPGARCGRLLEVLGGEAVGAPGLGRVGEEGYVVEEAVG